MAIRNQKLGHSLTMMEGVIGWRQFYSSNSKNSKVVDLKKLRPMILKRIQNRAKDYPVKAMFPVAQQVLRDRATLYRGVSILMHTIPVWACKFCPEVYIGEQGHLIRTCGGYRRCGKNHVHEWVNARLDDILVPIETFHLKNMFQTVIKHNQRFDFERVPAVLELCWQAGADTNAESLYTGNSNLDGNGSCIAAVESLSSDELRLVAKETLQAWETLRSGVQKLLLVYPAKVCRDCSEVHVGPSGHKARLCGVFKYESWRGSHIWKKADVDDLVPPKIVWYQRPQDPPVLLDKGRNFYGHLPVIVDLCTKLGAIAPSKYFCMMKVDGLSALA